ncbi:MAG: radical SAM protein, partial [Thermoplasmatales archaeon]|nr:radical SAM protein [Thermoplasmatales archaeon]
KRSLEDIPSADICVEGEGDLVIKDIAKSLEFGRKNLSEIEGVYYRENNNIKAGRPHKIIKDLDSIPFPARHLVDKYNYGMINNKYVFKPKLTSMVSSRGCPFNCRFCSRNAPVYKTYRQRSAENVVKEMLEINNKYKTLCIVDDNFLADKKRANKIMDSLIEEGTDLDLLILGARVDSADRELYKKMKKAGVKSMGFGIESGNQDVLDYYNKRITLDQIRKAVNLSREMNFITHGNFILGAPFETEKHFEETIKFACSLPLDIVLFNPLAYVYGSDLWDEAIQKGITPKDGGYTIGPEARKKLGNFTFEELLEFCQKAVKRFYLRPNYIIDQLIISIKRKNFRLIRTGLNNLL